MSPEGTCPTTPVENCRRADPETSSQRPHAAGLVNGTLDFIAAVIAAVVGSRRG